MGDRLAPRRLVCASKPARAYVPAHELTDRTVRVEDVWGLAAAGITPKLYARLARFQSGLAYVGSDHAEGGAHAALALGYADQSHWIAEFKAFSGLTPRGFAARHWFHPFVERVLRGRVRSPVSRAS